MATTMSLYWSRIVQPPGRIDRLSGKIIVDPFGCLFNCQWKRRLQAVKVRISSGRDPNAAVLGSHDRLPYEYTLLDQDLHYRVRKPAAATAVDRHEVCA